MWICVYSFASICLFTYGIPKRMQMQLIMIWKWNLFFLVYWFRTCNFLVLKKPEGNWGCGSWGTVFLFFEMVFHWPRIHQAGGLASKPQGRPASAISPRLQRLATMPNSVLFKIWAVAIELRRHFPDWAISLDAKIFKWTNRWVKQTKSSPC